ncbi:AAA family ATPase [Methylacidiphilum caldifontis]|uniref:AAA family ATPase n=1 Tax=Methylacidiphilum caldifontis TaxID=2795386 RepID=UPI001A903E59|nr:AAA family ATPase [Methylacidiphilum caldifontis]
MLDCGVEQDSRCTKLLWLDPLLENYESESHYLFAYIYRNAMRNRQTELQQNYVLPNISRRLLEAFLSFRYPKKAGKLWQHFNPSTSMIARRHVYCDSYILTRIMEKSESQSTICLY